MPAPSNSGVITQRCVSKHKLSIQGQDEVKSSALTTEPLDLRGLESEMTSSKTSSLYLNVD